MKKGQEVKVTIPFIYIIGDEGFHTNKILKTVNDCKEEVLAEIDTGVLNESEIMFEVFVEPENECSHKLKDLRKDPDNEVFCLNCKHYVMIESFKKPS